LIVQIDALDVQTRAVLLDVDGTILDIAATPVDVTVPHRLKRALERLHERAGGALAFVSGRMLSDLDTLFAPLKLPSVGGHGAEIRVREGEPRRKLDIRIDDGLKSRIKALVSKYDGVLLEDKGYSLALHYRLAPHYGSDVREAVVAACADFPTASIEILPGKAMVEVKPGAFNKGIGIRQLMTHPPFHGRQPVFIGDDITDRAAFAVLPEYDGLGFSVGHELEGLAGSFATPGAVRQWLYRAAGVDGTGQP
jgi:trehalose 6-phosphate phosphatase